MRRGRRNLFTWSRNYTRIQCTLRAAAKSPASCFDHSAPDDFRTRRSSIKGQRYGYTVDAPGTPGGQHCRRHRIQLKDQAAPAVLERSPGAQSWLHESHLSSVPHCDHLTYLHRSPKEQPASHEEGFRCRGFLSSGR